MAVKDRSDLWVVEKRELSGRKYVNHIYKVLFL